MCGKLFVAGVGVVVILRQQVNIVEEDAAPVFISESLSHTNIQQLGTIESTIPPLKSQIGRVKHIHIHKYIHLKTTYSTS